MILAILSSVLEILTNPPFSVYFLSFFFLVPFLIFLNKEERFWRLFLGSILWKIIFSFGSMYFVFDFFLEGLKFFPFLFFPIYVFFLKKYIAPEKVFIRIFLIGFGLFIFDSIFNYVWLSFLAANIGTSLAHSSFLGIARFRGIWGMGLFAVFINCILAYAYILYTQEKKYQKILLPIGFVLFFLIGGLLVSQYVLQKNKMAYESRKNTLSVAIISSNKNYDKEISTIPNIVSTEDALILKNFIQKRFRDIKNDIGNTHPDLIIFPEDMIDAETWNYADPEAKEKWGITSSQFLIEAFRDVAKTKSAYVLTNLTLERNSKRYNTELLFDPSGNIIDYYDKENLVIGGEIWPFGNWHPPYFNWIDIYDENSPREALKPIFNRMYGYTPGINANLFNIKNTAIGTLICAEILYPERAKDYINRGASFLLHSASNNWASIGLDTYRSFIQNLNKIDSVWLQTPVLLSGVDDYAGITLPNGTFKGVDFLKGINGYVIYNDSVRY